MFSRGQNTNALHHNYVACMPAGSNYFDRGNARHCIVMRMQEYVLLVVRGTIVMLGGCGGVLVGGCIRDIVNEGHN